LYVSWPAVSHNDSFMCFCCCCCCFAGCCACDEGFEGLLMLSSRDAGGPTGTMRDPNSTPMVTSWCGEKRPSQRRTVSYWAVSIKLWLLMSKAGRLHLIYHIQSLPAIQSLLCSPMVETCRVVMPHGDVYFRG
jgi:hypothetical protein